VFDSYRLFCSLEEGQNNLGKPQHDLILGTLQKKEVGWLIVSKPRCIWYGRPPREQHPRHESTRFSRSTPIDVQDHDLNVARLMRTNTRVVGFRHAGLCCVYIHGLQIDDSQNCPPHPHQQKLQTLTMSFGPPLHILKIINRTPDTMPVTPA